MAMDIARNSKFPSIIRFHPPKGCNTSIQQLACWDHVDRDTFTLSETVQSVISWMKRCPKCGEVKKLDGFYHLQSSKDGYMRHCKQCHSEIQNIEQEKRQTKDAVHEKKPTDFTNSPTC